MKMKLVILSVVILCASYVLTSVVNKQSDSNFEAKSLRKRALVFYEPIHEYHTNDHFEILKINLGKMLFFDNRLSKSNTLSCSNCHAFTNFGTDNTQLSYGDEHKLQFRNTPTILNLAVNTIFNWDARFKTLEEHASRLLLNKFVMGNDNVEEIEQKLSSIPGYVVMFSNLYPNDSHPVNYKNIISVLVSYEKSLQALSRFDKFLSGDNNILNNNEKRGLNKFINLSCFLCHEGKGIGGNQLMKFGITGNYWNYTKSTVIDSGIYKYSGVTNDVFRFRVPSLRNVARTYPYFHDGSIATLHDAVKIMAKLQLSVDLDEEAINDLVAFLNALTSEIPEEMLKVPILPQSAGSMPK